MTEDGHAVAQLLRRSSDFPVLLQWQQFDVPVPAITAVILQTKIALAGMLLVRDIKLVHRSIRSPIRFRPFIQIDPINLLSIELNFQSIFVARNHDVVPFPGGLHRILRRFHQVVDRACIVESRGGRVVDGNLNPVEPNVFTRTRSQRKRPDKDAAITFF